MFHVKHVCRMFHVKRSRTRKLEPRPHLELNTQHDVRLQGCHPDFSDLDRAQSLVASSFKRNNMTVSNLGLTETTRADHENCLEPLRVMMRHDCRNAELGDVPPSVGQWKPAS